MPHLVPLFASRYNTLDPFDLWLRLGLPSTLVLELPDYRLCTVIERVE